MTALKPKHLRIYLIKPSKYDDDGYVIRYWKGVLPSNTLACLYGLTDDVREREALGADLRWSVHAIDETVERIDIPKICRLSQDPETRTLICLAGVQSNQFSRAADLALEFRKFNIPVMVGGFHVSGVIAMLPRITPELQELTDHGVTLVAGEVEAHWESLLKDALENRLAPIYNFLSTPPDLSCAVVPKVPPGMQKRYTVGHFATLDCGRGCPFRCSFCTVIQVQGRTMRVRSVECIVRMVRRNYKENGTTFYFFTDDNFARNKHWEELLDALALVRENEIPLFEFMMQADTQSHRIPRFIEKAAKAGCSQVFIGLESMNPANLKSSGKGQNRVSDYRVLVETYQKYSIGVHLSYIIGFPEDSEESVAQDVECLAKDLLPQQASFFMMTPLPGSQDHKEAFLRGMRMDADLNQFDSQHETFRHEKMPDGAWTRTYWKAWKGFYNTENMIRILRSTSAKKYWDVFLNFIWYKNSIDVEGGHPMLHGFFRLKSRSERRRIFGMESRFVYFKRRVREISAAIRGWTQLLVQMEEVWLATRHRTVVEEKIVEEVGRFREWREMRVGELQSLYKKTVVALKCAGESIPMSVKIPSQPRLLLQKWGVLADSLTNTRSSMTGFWQKTVENWKHRKFWKISYLTALWMAFRESTVFARFIASVMKRREPTPTEFRRDSASAA